MEPLLEKEPNDFFLLAQQNVIAKSYCIDSAVWLADLLRTPLQELSPPKINNWKYLIPRGYRMEKVYTPCFLPMSRRCGLVSQCGEAIMRSAIGGSCKAMKFPEHKLILVRQGADIEKFCSLTNEEKASSRKEMSIGISVPVVVFVGAIIYRKGVDNLINAWKAIQSKIPDALLLLVGPDLFGEDDANTEELNHFV